MTTRAGAGKLGGMLALLALLGVAPPSGGPHAGDGAPLLDPGKPVVRIERQRVVLEYFTLRPTETRVQFREAGLPVTAWAPPGQRRDPWAGGYAEARKPGTMTTWHQIELSGLKPGTRYYYRIADPGPKTRLEVAWGATELWRREYAVSTLAPRGMKSIIQVPVKVLLMPNVVNLGNAPADAPAPEPMTPAQLEMIKEEYREASRFFWVNSGMRFWVDWEFFVDARWQLWGREMDAAFQTQFGQAPMSRAYPGVEFRPPGGGAFTILDTRDVERANTDPVVEDFPFAGQIEQAFLRRWDAAGRRWAFVNSGGGALGIDGWPNGVPARAQFLGAGDTAWLTCHEFHHQMESFSAFSLANREDERVVFNHYAPRFRERRADGGYDENAWTTNGPHGEHWDGMRYWDRWVTDVQWLRMYVGRTVAVRDRDEDGLPDDDPRLPLDERRFGSNPRRAKTDGLMTDLHKAMLGTWIPNPLQPSWVKPEPQYPKIDLRSTDQDGDGALDTVDPYPLWGYPLYVWPMRASVDGDPSEWRDVPLNGSLRMGGMEITYRHSYDAAGLYVLLEASGPWRRIELTIDGEGDGVFGRRGVQWMHIVKTGENVEVRQLDGRAPGLVWRAARVRGNDVIELSLPNRGEGTMFWQGAGRLIGTQLNAFAEAGAGYAMGSPYTVFYARMLESHGQPPAPPSPPAELAPGPGVTVLSPGMPELTDPQAAWRREGDALAYDGSDERLLVIQVPSATEFDFWVRMTAVQDGILGAFLPGTQTLGAGSDYIAFVGGYANQVTRFRLFGQEAGDGAQMMTPDRPRNLQFSRRGGFVWLLVDGSVTAWAIDPQPSAAVERLGIVGGYGGRQRVHEVRYRVRAAPP